MSSCLNGDEFEIGDSHLVFTMNHGAEPASLDWIFEFEFQLINFLFIQEALKVTDLDHLKLSKLRSKLNQVKSKKPLSNRHLVNLFNVTVKKLFGILKSFLWLVSILQEMTLELSHR